MSKKFEYELTLRLEKAEKAIASLASKIEKDLGKAVDAAFKGSSEFDVAKQDLDKMIASAIALDKVQREAAQFTLKLEQDRLGVVRERIQMEMNAADEAMRDAFERRQAESNLQAKEDSARAEKQRGLEKAFSGGVPLDVKESEELRAIRNIAAEKQMLNDEETQREIQRYEGEKRRSEEEHQRNMDNIRQKAQLKSEMVDRDVTITEGERERQLKADAELAESTKRTNEGAMQDSRSRAAEKQRLRQEDEQREAEAAENIRGIMQKSRAERERVAQEEKQRLDARRVEREQNEDAYAKRLTQNTKLLKEYYAQYSDPKAVQAIQLVEKALEKHSFQLKFSGVSQKEQAKAHEEYTKGKIEALDKLVGKEKQAGSDRIESIRKSMAADSAASAVRYKDHHEVLRRVKLAEEDNANDLIALQQRITGMTKKEIQDEIAAFQKLAKAKIDSAVDAGYKMEALTAQQAASGAKGVSTIFQVQQGIEDAMYAGLRGAGNNIAFLLTKVTSSWVAIGGLIGVATLQLADHLGVFEKLNEAYDGALWKTKEQVRYEEQLLRLKKEQLDREDQKKEDEARFSPASKTLTGLQDEIKEKKEILTGQRERQFAYERTIELVTELKNRQKELRGVEKAMEEDLLPITVNEKKELERRKAELENQISKLKGRIEDQKPGFTADELVKNAKAFEVVQEKAENFGSAVAKTTDEVKNLLEQLKPVEEVSFRKEAMEWVKQETLDMMDRQIEQSKDVVKAREEELRTVQQTLATAEQLLKTEQNREDAIRKAASAREDEFAKQKLGLQNTILDMEASETAKKAKTAADSKEQAVKEELKAVKQWAEHQAKVDKFNANQKAKLYGKNPQSMFDIDAAKTAWINNQEQIAQAKIEQIRKDEEATIASAKKTAEIAKQANLDAMEVVQKKKVEDLLEEARQQQLVAKNMGDPAVAQEKFNDAQDAMDKAQKTLKEIADAKVGNLNQKDSVGQGKDALREWEELTKRIKALDEQKIAMTKEAQEADKERILQIKAQEDQAAARLETVKEQHQIILDKKEQISKTPFANPDDQLAVEKYIQSLHEILNLRVQIGGIPMQGPMTAPGFGGPLPLPGGGGTGIPAPPTLGGGNININMGGATPNAAMAAAMSYQQNQRALAMLSGN